MKKLLDIGCGPGTINNLGYYYRLKKSYQIHGVDFLKKNIQTIKKRFPNGIFKVANAEELPFKNNEFSCILCRHVLEHVENLEKVVKEMNRVAQKGASLIIAVPHKNLEKKLSKIIPHYIEHGHHHQRVFDDKKIKSVLQKNGFSVISIRNKKWPMFLIVFLLAYISKILKSIEMEEQSGIFTVHKRSYLNNTLMYPLYIFFFLFLNFFDALLPFLNKSIPFEIEIYAIKK